MPELAEVQWFSRQWDPGRGKPVLKVHIQPQARVFRGENVSAFQKLRGQQLLETRTHGKHMLFAFSGGLWLSGHLGMTGEILTLAPLHRPEKHDHLVLQTGDGALVFRDPRMFGRLSLHIAPSAPEWWTALPPEIMSKGFTVNLVRDFLKRRARTPLKALLLEQEAFPGIGNWMADEAMWQLRLHPGTPAGSADPHALHQVLRKITGTALRTIGRDWSDPPRAWLFQHRWKAGANCPRCRSALARETLRGRTACWCPCCQPE